MDTWLGSRASNSKRGGLGGNFSRAEEKASASVEGEGGDDHWATVLKDSEPPATGVHLLSLESLQPAYLLQYSVDRGHVLPCDNHQPSLYSTLCTSQATDGLAFVRAEPCGTNPAAVSSSGSQRKGAGSGPLVYYCTDPYVSGWCGRRGDTCMQLRCFMSLCVSGGWVSGLVASSFGARSGTSVRRRPRWDQDKPD